MEQEHTSPAGFDRALELIREHGSALAIPLEALVEIGYVRHGDGTLAPEGVNVRTARTLEQKNEAKPFEPFRAALIGGRGNRYLNDTILDRLQVTSDELADIQSFGFWINGAGSGGDDQVRELAELPLPDPVQLFYSSVVDNLAVFYPQCGRDRDPLLLRAQSGFLKNISAHEAANQERYSTVTEREELLEALEDEDAPEARNDFVDYLSSVIEYERARIADVDELKKAFDTGHLGFDTLLSDDSNGVWEEFVEKSEGLVDQIAKANCEDRTSSLFTEAIEQAVEQVEREVYAHIEWLKDELGIETQGQLIMYMLGTYIHNHFPELETEDAPLVARAMQLKSSSTAAAWLESLKARLVESAKAELKLAKADYQAVPRDQPEQKHRANERFNAAKRSLKEAAGRLQPMVDAFNRPYASARWFNRQFDKMQDVLHGGSESTAGILEFVADINPAIDENPGVISGDCTENIPLPFLDTGNNLFNVKVYSGGRHIGNIYLLEVFDEGNKPMAWHLDAVQIPLHANWEATVPEIIKGFKTAGEKRGITAITVNNSGHLVSNYDYISKEILKHTQGRADNEIEQRIRKTAPGSYSVDDNEENEDDQSGMQLHQSAYLYKLM